MNRGTVLISLPNGDILQGDCRETLQSLPEQSVHCVVTSPPYWGLRDYGVNGQIGLEDSMEAFIDEMVSVFREVWRVLRDDGTCWLNLGDSYGSSGGDTYSDFNLRYSGTGGVGSKQNAALDGVKDRKVETGLRPKNLMGIPWRVALALQADGWYLRQDIIWHKCLSGGAKVYARTQKGDMPMTIKDLVRLDPSTVKLWNGQKWTQCFSWSETPRPVNPIEIELRSGESIGCTANHVWPTQRGNVRADELRVGDVIQSTELPEPDDLYQPRNIDGSVAWLIGLYLAEGSFDSKGRMQFAGHSRENDIRSRRLEGIARDFGGTVRAYFNENSGNIVVDCPALAAIVKQYVHGNTARNKGLKVRVWRHSNKWIDWLLAGYLQGDGCKDTENDRWRLGFTRNDRLAVDLRTICARLGYRMTLKKSTAKAFEKDWPIYRGEIRLQSETGHHNEKQRCEVVSIGNSRARKFYDIAVEDDPHLFALASGVLTHNSNPMPESCRDRCTKAHEYIFLLTKKPRYWYDAEAIKEQPASATLNDSRLGASGTGRDRYSSDGKGSCPSGFTGGYANGANKRSVWTVPTYSYKGAHFATFPPKLIEPCILAGCPEVCCSECGAGHVRILEKVRRPTRPGENTKVPGRNSRAFQTRDPAHAHEGYKAERYEQVVGNRDPERHVTETVTVGWEPSCECNAETAPGVVLDPFGGSGTTGEVAKDLGRRFILCELNAEYVKLMRKRLKQGALC